MLRKKINRLIENIRIFIYDTTSIYEKLDTVFSFLFSLYLITLIVYFNTFFLDKRILKYLFISENIILFFYSFRLLMRYIYNINENKNFIKGNILEFILLLITSGVVIFLRGLYLEFFMKGILLFYLMVDLSKFFSNYVSNIKVSNHFILILSFGLLILIGAGLLMAPRMTVDGKGLDFLTAIFSSTSASCVTGLTLIDISQILSLRGQAVILILMQFGGLNMIIFASFFIVIRGDYNSRYQNMLKENLNTNSVFDNRIMIRKIFSIIFFLEGLGVFLMYISLPKDYFNSNLEMIFHSIFHSISAFNNAGFTSFSPDFQINHFRKLYLFQIIIMTLIVLGGIGFPVIKEFMSVEIFKKGAIKRLSLTTRIVIKTTVFLIILGSIFFFFLEYSNTLKDKPLFDKIITSFFQSITTRTAGFNTVEIPLLKLPTMTLFLMLMFIGASPGSTGGGIKTTVFYLLNKYILSFFNKKKNIEYDKNFISFNSINKATVSFVFGVFFIFSAVFVLTIVEEDKKIMDLVFETVSAFATVGLSTGITPKLSEYGQIIIIITMFVGRIGLLTLGFSIVHQSRNLNYNYKETDIII